MRTQVFLEEVIPLKKFQAIRGMNDILPDQMAHWHFLEKTLQDLADNFGYDEIRFPIVESLGLFQRTIGEVTDIVEKEMYAFADRNGDDLALRPEGTAGCVRAAIEHGLIYNQTRRLWYMGPMYRHERPQRGRYRQFYQFGLEAFGFSGPDIDAELILFLAQLWRRLGLEQYLELQINSLGTSEVRARYRTILVDYFSGYGDQLDEDSQRRLTTNPLRILDSKNPQMAGIIAKAPTLLEHLDNESTDHFQQFCGLLDAAKITYTVNPRLVRGLDYYGKTVFEWVTTELGAQGTVCAGGRYDGLVEQLGGHSTPGIGFSMGLERVIELIDVHKTVEHSSITPHAYLICMGHQEQGFALTQLLRQQVPTLRLVMHCGGGNFKKQFKKADKSGAQLALLLGDDEIANQTVTVKFLREEKTQVALPQEQLILLLAQLANEKELKK